MSIEHQIAQKLHAVSSPGDRARDLIDLQLIAKRVEISPIATKMVCERLFAYRKAQGWPPVVVKQAGWGALYEELASDLPVVDDIDDAIAWVNELIAIIDAAC